MSSSVYVWAACVAIVLGGANAVTFAEERNPLHIGGGEAFRENDRPAVSNGHLYLVSKEPGFLFGGVQDDQGRWQLTYLVLIKHHARPASTFAFDATDPEVSSASSDGKVRRFHFQKTLSIDKAVFAVAYKAVRDLASDRVLSEELTIQDKPLDLSKGRIVIVDMTVSPARHQQVDAKLPACERIDFLSSTSQDYRAFTKRWMAELAKDSQVVREAFSSAD